MKKQAQLSLLLAALSGPFVLTGCHHHSSNNQSNNNPDTLYEVEPNGNALNPDFIGSVVPGDFLNIEGFITNDGSDDYDGFGFVALQPLDVEFRLFIDNPGADLDVRIYDPEFDDFPASFTSVFNPEVGSFTIRTSAKEFHIVVESALGASTYFMEVDFFPPTIAPAATEGDQPVSDVVAMQRLPQRENSGDLSHSSYLRSNAPAAPAAGPTVDASVTPALEITIDAAGTVTTRAGLLVRPRPDESR